MSSTPDINDVRLTPGYKFHKYFSNLAYFGTSIPVMLLVKKVAADKDFKFPVFVGSFGVVAAFFAAIVLYIIRPEVRASIRSNNTSIFTCIFVGCLTGVSLACSNLSLASNSLATSQILKVTTPSIVMTLSYFLKISKPNFYGLLGVIIITIGSCGISYITIKKKQQVKEENLKTALRLLVLIDDSELSFYKTKIEPALGVIAALTGNFSEALKVVYLQSLTSNAKFSVTESQLLFSPCALLVLLAFIIGGELEVFKNLSFVATNWFNFFLIFLTGGGSNFSGIYVVKYNDATYFKILGIFRTMLIMIYNSFSENKDERQTPLEYVFHGTVMVGFAIYTFLCETTSLKKIELVPEDNEKTVILGSASETKAPLTLENSSQSPASLSDISCDSQEVEQLI